VNFIMHTAAPKEKEFLLPPYTVLTLKKVIESDNLQLKPHQITVDVADDNQGKSLPERLPLVDWL
jgi:hypothetical protein